MVGTGPSLAFPFSGLRCVLSSAGSCPAVVVPGPFQAGLCCMPVVGSKTLCCGGEGGNQELLQEFVKAVVQVFVDSTLGFSCKQEQMCTALLVLQPETPGWRYQGFSVEHSHVFGVYSHIRLVGLIWQSLHLTPAGG